MCGGGGGGASRFRLNSRPSEISSKTLDRRREEHLRESEQKAFPVWSRDMCDPGLPVSMDTSS